MSIHMLMLKWLRTGSWSWDGKSHVRPKRPDPDLSFAAHAIRDRKNILASFL